jgi:hypothetical protein
MSNPVPKPVWGADCPVSMPLPVPQSETKLVGMHGFSMTQYRMVHDITQAEYEGLAVPVYSPVNPGAQVAGDVNVS